jgi:DNA-binding NtrC family response regulator
MKTKILHPHFPLLIVDDEKPWLNSLSLTLRTAGITNIECCSESRQVMKTLASKQYAAVILDMIMPHITGEKLLPEITKHYPDIPVIITTALDQVDTAVNCMRSGAFDYQVKGNEEDRLTSAIKRAIEISQLRQENILLKDHFLHDRINHPEIFAPIVTMSKLMRSLFQYIEAIAHTG